MDAIVISKTWGLRFTGVFKRSENNRIHYAVLQAIFIVFQSLETRNAMTQETHSAE